MTPKAEAQVKSANLKITGFELWQYTGDAKQYNDYLTEEYPQRGLARAGDRAARSNWHLPENPDRCRSEGSI